MSSLKVFKTIAVRVSLIAVVLLSLMVSLTSPAAAASGNANGAVFTLTNAAAGNEVLMYNRSSDGSLAFDGAYATGGLGSGAGLGSQTALVLTENNRWLFAVNAGSNEISAFAVRRDGLKLVDVVDSGGELPVSLTVHKDLLYVLNAGGSGNISGFSIGKRGSLTPLAGSTQPVSNGGIGAAPATGPGCLQLGRQRPGRDGKRHQPAGHLPGRGWPGRPTGYPSLRGGNALRLRLRPP